MTHYQVIIIGGGHAGAEAAWAAANLLPRVEFGRSVALVTLDPAKIGVMPCNPAIGGLAKGQIVREVDALGGLMGFAADATGIQFRVLNTSRGPAVRGPRCQCDKHAYAEAVQGLIASREEIEVIAGSVERLLVRDGQERAIEGVEVQTAEGLTHLTAGAVVLTTGTFMRGLMHTGEMRRPGGREGEAAASGLSGALERLGFELGRLKTGTPPRLKRSTIDWDNLPEQPGDDPPVPFSDLSWVGRLSEPTVGLSWVGRLSEPTVGRPFPHLPQIACRSTETNQAIHDLIRANIHRAPMFSGQIESIGPRYCPSIEDKVVRFAERTGHGVFLEPESLRDDSVYCNGIATSLPVDVQEGVVRLMPGCERAEILKHGYAVEYDMVRPHQIQATGETKLIAGLYLAGQINGTSGYEEAAAQGLVAGVNAALRASWVGRLSEPTVGRPRANPSTECPQFVLGRDEAFIGVLMDDLVTKTPVEPYRMFTSRAEHRLLLRADNAADRLTPRAITLGMLDHTDLGAHRKRLFERRQRELAEVNTRIDAMKTDGPGGRRPFDHAMRQPGFAEADLRRALPDLDVSDEVILTACAERRYRPYIERSKADIRRMGELERRRIPEMDVSAIQGLRAEAAQALTKFRPATFGQAGRLEGVTPADLTLLSIHAKRMGVR